MEKKTVSLGATILVGQVKLVPIIKTRVGHWRCGGAASFFGAKRPVGILVITPTATQAFAVSGEKLTVQQLADDVPEIKALIQ